jgi:hypothetical protein
MNRYLISAVACMGLIACADAGGTLGTNSKRTVVDQEDDGASSSSGGKTSSSGGTTGDPDAAKPPEAAPTTGPGSDGSKGKQEFIKTVFASLSPSCGGCHTAGSGGAPKFWDNGSASNTYQLLDQRALITAQGSMISTKGSHASGGGPALTSAQNGVVGTWLALEAQDRVGQKAPEDILAKLGNCIDPADWRAAEAGMRTLRTQQRQGENANTCSGCANETCVACHADGSYGMIVGPQNQALQDTLPLVKQKPFITRYFGLNGADPVGSGAVAAKATATQTGAAHTHPRYTMNQQATQGVDTFVARTIEKYKAGNCAAAPPP